LSVEVQFPFGASVLLVELMKNLTKIDSLKNFSVLASGALSEPI
jgi:hypothetical protein